MFKRIEISVLATAALLAFACSGDDEASSTTETTSATHASLLQNVPINQIDGSTSSDKFEAAPSGASPTVSLEAARSKVLAEAMGADILEMVLLNYVDQLNDPPNPPKLAWVGNLVPETFAAFVSGGVPCDDCPPRGEPHTLYAYVVIDATTGEFMHTATSSYFETPSTTAAP